jgi:multidrug efflux pump subunit AcrB
LFREFGLVLATAVAISAFVSLSLVPAMAARLPDRPGLAGGDATVFDRIGARLRALGTGLARRYDAGLAWALQHPLLTVIACLGLAGGAALLYPTLGQELLPQEDRGVIYVDATGPDGVGLTYMERQAERMEAVMQPLVDQGIATSLSTMIGNWDPNRARVIAPLAPWDERERSQQSIVEQIRGPMNNIPGANVRISSPNSLNLRGRVGEIQVALIGNDYPAIYTAAKNLALAIEDELPNLSNPDIDYRPTQPQLSVEIDRRRAADLGISLESIATTLRALVDGDDLVDLNVADQTVPIILESASNQIDDPSDLVNLYVSARDGRLLPLSSVVTLREESVAAQLDRYAQRRGIEVTAALAPGYPLAKAVEDLRTLAAEILPDDVSLIFLGEAETLDEASHEVVTTYVIALVVVFLLLCAQFENLISALIVMLIVPFGLAAAVFALFLTGTTVNIYSQIGLVMLIGLMAKNGILLVEFADQMRDRGKSVYDAVVIAARVRLRPIAMTTLATVVGGVPLILSADPGAAARSSIGWIIFGGLGIAALFTLFLTPAIYLLLSRFHKPRAFEGRKLAEEMLSADLTDESDEV